MKKNLHYRILGLMLFTALVLIKSNTQAQTLIAFDLLQTSWGTQDLQPTTIATNVSSPTGISRVGSISTSVASPNTSTSNRWGGISFAGGTTEPTTGLRYFTISIQASSNYALKLDSISYMKLSMSSGSPNYFAIKYSVDNGATYTDITTHIVTPKPTATSNQLIPKTDLTGITALQNVTGKVIFMILPYNGSNSNGNNYNYIQFGNYSGSTGVSSAAVSGDAIAIKGSVNSTLPVKLSSFTSSIQNQAALLKWNTESEVNFDYFSVEKKDTNNDFKEIGRVSAKGGNVTNSYNFSDPQVSFETNYYRLKMVDKDGSVDYSKIITASLPSQNFLSLWPNPIVNQTAKVQFKELSSVSTLKVIDLSGKTLISLEVKPGSGTADLDLSKLLKGQYILILENNGQKLDNLKFLKED